MSSHRPPKRRRRRRYMSKTKSRPRAAEDSESEDDEGPSTVERQDNTLYLYGEITECKILKFITQLKQLDKEMQILGIKYDVDPPPIKIVINSEGGDLMATLGACDVIRGLKTKTISIVAGSAASAGTLISVVCDHRRATKHSFLLIHNLSSAMGGNLDSLKTEMTNLEAINDKATEIYKRYTSIPSRKLGALLQKDDWMDAETSKRYGLIDEIDA